MLKITKGKIKHVVVYYKWQCFSTAGLQPGTGPWHQLYQAVRHSPGTDN